VAVKSLLASHVPSRVNTWLRQLRAVAYWGLEPIDYLSRKANHLDHYPPISLRRRVGFLNGFDGVPCEFVAYLKLLCGLNPESRLLDMGCGCGLLELELEEVITRGECYGFDIHKPSINWASKAIGKRSPHFRFIHADIHNEAYWPSGRLDARAFLDQLRVPPLDIIVAKSLFTHMMPDELPLYFHAVATNLTTDGKAMLTFFLLNEDQARLEVSGRNQIAFLPPDGESMHRIRYQNAPTAAVAYEETPLVTRLASAGLQVVETRYGSWSGREDGLSFQDILIVRRSA
jgi:predicted TPR repeat methyltransferase